MSNIISRTFRVRVGEGRKAYFFSIIQDDWGNLSVRDIKTPRGPILETLPLPEHVVNAMCDALEVVRNGQGCIDPVSGTTGMTGITGATGQTGCTGFTFI